MGNIASLLKQAWAVTSPDTRFKIKRMMIVNGVGMSAFIVLNLVSILLFPTSPELLIFLAMGGNLFIGGALVILYYWTVVQVHRAIKADYFARAFPGDANAEQSHWTHGQGFLLALALLGLGAFIPNVIGIVLSVLTGTLDFSQIGTVVWIVIALVTVPVCCRRYVLGASDPELPSGA